MEEPNPRRRIAIFLLYTWGLSCIFYFLIVASGHAGGGGGAYISGLMWCPSLAAVLTCKHLGRNLSSLGWKWGPARYLVICYCIPLAYSVLTYAAVWIGGFGGFPNREFVSGLTQSFGLGAMPTWASVALYFFFTATINVIRDFPTVLGEEIGWRGFLVPELATHHGFAATATLSGLVWAIWHYPVLLFADYTGHTPVFYYLPLFTIGVPLLCFTFAWMRLKTGSIWPGVLLHASHNTFIQTFFDPLTVENSKTRYVAGEFGIFLYGPVILLAVYFWSRRGEVNCNTEAPSFTARVA